MFNALYETCPRLHSDSFAARWWEVATKVHHNEPPLVSESVIYIRYVIFVICSKTSVILKLHDIAI